MGVGAHLLKELLLAFDRDFNDGTARLAVVAGASLPVLLREAMAGYPVPQLVEAMTQRAAEAGDLLATDLQVVPDLVEVARASGLSDVMASELASLAAEVGTEASFDIREDGDRDLTITRSQGFAVDVKPIGNDALPSLSSVNVLVADEIITDFGAIASVLEGFATRHKSLVIAARGITGTALATLKANQAAKIVTVAAMQPADMGSQAAEVLEDLATATGATLIAERFGTRIGRLKPAMLGRAKAFMIEQGRATFISPEGKPEDIAARRKFLAAQADKAKYLSYDRECYERRRARLAGVWCQMGLMGATPQETSMLVERTRAAMANLQSVLRHGAVQGGGGAYAELASRLSRHPGQGVDAAALRCLVQALTSVPRQLIANAADEKAAELLSKRRQDPLVLTKAVLNQAVGFSTLMLRSGAIIAR